MKPGKMKEKKVEKSSQQAFVGEIRQNEECRSLFRITMQVDSQPSVEIFGTRGLGRLRNDIVFVMNSRMQQEAGLLLMPKRLGKQSPTSIR
jgi:hypothetical protein